MITSYSLVKAIYYIFYSIKLTCLLWRTRLILTRCCPLVWNSSCSNILIKGPLRMLHVCVYACIHQITHIYTPIHTHIQTHKCTHARIHHHIHWVSFALSFFQCAKFVWLARTVYIHRIWPHIWWFPCQNYRIYTVHIDGSGQTFKFEVDLASLRSITWERPFLHARRTVSAQALTFTTAADSATLTLFPPQQKTRPTWGLPLIAGASGLL
jgi:hypothetical protein